MNLYFDYNYDYINKPNLKKNTLLLIHFLKSRYPKKVKKKSINDKNEKKELFNKNMEIKDKDKLINNDINSFNLKNRNNNDNKNNYKGKNIFPINSKTYNKDKNNIFSNNNKKLKTTSNKSTSENNILSFKKPFLKNNLKLSKTYSSNNLDKTQQKIKREKNINKMNKIKNFKTSNVSLMIIGKPIMEKDDFFYYYKFPKVSSPITKINIELLDKFNKTNKNNFCKFPFLLKMTKNSQQKYEMNNSTNLILKEKKYELNNNNNNDIEKKEDFILEYLNKIKIISIEQKNKNYLWQKLIPDLKDGYIIGKLINLLEKKNNNYLKGISKETYYKVNIYYNWQKIIDFLINKNSFNSIYLYIKNFYSNDKNIFDFLYDLLKFYHDKEKIKEKENKYKFKINGDNKYNINISKIQNISNHIISDNSNYSKSISNYAKSIQNKTHYSTSITKNNTNKKINKNDYLKEKKNNYKTNITPLISEIMNIRKSINYIHKGNNSLILFNNKENKNSNKDNNKLNKTEDLGYNIKKNENFYFKGENILFDKKVKIIISFLELIGINTSQINFYAPEMKIFKDGILLHQIISQLESNTSIIPKIDLNPKNPSTAINNHRILINFLDKYKKNFPVVLIKKERELYKATPKFILKFLHALKSIYNNEVFYYKQKNEKEERNIKINKNNKINPKNIDKSERFSLPLSQELRSKFLIKDNEQIWA